MKNSVSKSKAGTERPSKDSHQNTGAGTATTKRQSASQKATVRAQRGEPLKTGSKADRSPKQENL